MLYEVITQVMGVRRTADFLEKATWTLAGVLLALSILASWVIDKPVEEVKSRIETQMDASDFDAGLPQMPAGMPDDQPQE